MKKSKKAVAAGLILLAASAAIAVSVGTTSSTTTTLIPTTSTPATTSVPSSIATTVPGGLTPSGPIRITASNVVYDGYRFAGSGRCVTIENASNVTIKNSVFENCGTGIYALSSSDIKIETNQFINSGRNYIQFDKVLRGHILNNTGANQLGNSTAEDFVSIYKSNGTQASPILIEGNDFRNGGPSSSGSGFMLGDYGGSWIIARNNTLINPGQVGIGVAGGDNITVTGNFVRSDSHPWSNVGIYAWNQGAPSCTNITVQGNDVVWRNASGNLNNYWFASNCQVVR